MYDVHIHSFIHSTHHSINAYRQTDTDRQTDVDITTFSAMRQREGSGLP